MPEDNASAPKQENWSQRGLGWLPDYPDLRDYQLDKEEIQRGGRLNKEEVTGNLEILADSLISSLKKIQKQEEFETIIKDLEEKVFGNISFLNVRLRKILRPTPERFEKILPSLSPLLYYQDDLSRQSLHELKTYLYFLLLKSGDSKFPKIDNSRHLSDEDTKPKIRDLKENIACALQWLKEPTFDSATAELLKRVEHWVEVQTGGASCDEATTSSTNSGIVGPQTYAALAKVFSSGNSTNAATSQEQMPQEASLKLNSLPPVQLISIPSLIPSEFVKTLFEELINICSKQLNEEGRSKLQPGEPEKDIFESSFFMENKMSAYPASCFKSILSRFTDPAIDNFLFAPGLPPLSDVTSDKIRDWLLKNRDFWFTLGLSQKEKKSCKTRDKLLLARSCKVFNNDLKVIEPLISVALRLVTPIASFEYRNLSEVIVDSLQKFGDLTENPDLLKPSHVDEYNRFLAAEALQKTRQELDIGLGLVTGEIVNLQVDQKTLKNLEKELRSSSDQLEIELQLLRDNCDKAEYQERLRQLEKELESKQEKLKSIQKKFGLIQGRCREKESNLGATLYFYFLIKKFVRYHCQKLQRNHSEFLKRYDIDFSQAEPKRQANFFDKREILEIANPERFYRKDFSLGEIEDKTENEDAQDFQLFPIESLHIPVLISLSQLLGLNYLDQQTQAYFFLPGVVDLSFWCTPVEDQGTLQSCTAMAGIALMEYFVNRSLRKYTDLSPLFLYKVARKQLNLTGDVGASLRETMKAMALFGVPPESAWEYDLAKVDEEPPPFSYSYAQNYQALKYFRLDYAGISREALLFQIKAVLSSGFPCMFGFTIYTSAYEDGNAKQGWIPFPDATRDRMKGGHAVVAVGYDDYKVIRRADLAGDTLGAFLIRNCWGTKWGQGGYGWIPYDYVRQGLTRDWWSLLKAEWFESNLLGVGANDFEGPKWPLRSSLEGAFWIGGPGG